MRDVKDHEKNIAPSFEPKTWGLLSLRANYQRQGHQHFRSVFLTGMSASSYV